MALQLLTRSLAIGTAGIALGVLCGAPVAEAVDKYTSVLVVNDDTKPVPTKQIGTSTVQVSGTPSVSLAGTPTVNLAGVPEVRVASQELVQRYVEFGAGEFANCQPVSLPTDKPFVVQALHANLSATAQGGGVALRPTVATQNGATASPMIPVDLKPFGDDFYVGTIQTVLRVIPQVQSEVGDVIGLNVCARAGEGEVFTRALVVGYLE